MSNKKEQNTKISRNQGLNELKKNILKHKSRNICIDDLKERFKETTFCEINKKTKKEANVEEEEDEEDEDF